MLHLRPPQSLPTPCYASDNSLDCNFDYQRSAFNDHTQAYRPRSATPTSSGSRGPHANGGLRPLAAPEPDSSQAVMDGHIYTSGLSGQYMSFGQGDGSYDANHSQAGSKSSYETGYGLTAQHAIHNGQSFTPSRPSSRPESPVFQADDASGPSRRGSQQGGIVSYLQIPSTVSTSKGSLAEFAAQVR